MNSALLKLEFGVLVLGLGVLLLDLWLPATSKRALGYLAAVGVGLILVSSYVWPLPTARVVGTLTPETNAVSATASAPTTPTTPAVPAAPANAAGIPASTNGVNATAITGGYLLQMALPAFGQSYIFDGLALFFKRFFLLAALLVLLMSVEFAGRIESGISEFYSLILFALAGMMFASSANDFAMLFVSVELIAVTFYILTSFQRNRLASLEAGVKYLILGAMASAFMVYGIALVYGTSGTMSFGELAVRAAALKENPVFVFGFLLIIAGLAFKLAAFPFQIWAPDVYQGSPAPITAFLAVGSKAAGMVLLLRVLFGALPFEISSQWNKALMVISAVTILYGSLCAIPQRNLKRLFGYSSIANAGYLLLGVAAMSRAGTTAIAYYLGGYLFTVLAAFIVICLVMRTAEAEDISALVGLNQRSPLLATTMTLAMASLAGVPPLAGFFGKFLLFKAALEQGPSYYWLVGVALIGVVISFYYYFGVIRAIYWSKEPGDLSPLTVSVPLKISLATCIVGMLYLGIYPSPFLKMAGDAVMMTR